MIEGAKGGELFIVDNSISGWTGLRYHGSTGHSERGVSTVAQLSDPTEGVVKELSGLVVKGAHYILDQSNTVAEVCRRGAFMALRCPEHRELSEHRIGRARRLAWNRLDDVWGAG